MPVVVASIDVMNNIYNRGLMSSLRFCLGFLLNRTGKNVTMMQLIMGHEVSVLPKPLLHDHCSQFLLGITVVPSEIENICI